MIQSEHFRLLYDSDGKLYAAMLSADMWTRNRSRLEPIIRSMLEKTDPPAAPEPLGEWEEFTRYWDFAYPLCADVECGNCKSKSDNWISDPAKPFRLKSAQLGGLAVFHCNTCGATVRKKHFKDHICFEFSIDADCR